MTILERVRQIVQSDIDLEVDTAGVEKLVYLAYYIGKEEATREVSDMYTSHIAEQRNRAESCRYHKMAQEVVGPETYLYHPDYSMPMTTVFGSDNADI